MKSLFSLLLICSIAVPLSAQTITQQRGDIKKHYRAALSEMLGGQMLGAGTYAKTTATAERLVATSRYEGGGRVDSSRIFYSNGRGSDHSGNDLRGCLNQLYSPEYEHFPYAESPLTQSADLRIFCDSLIAYDGPGTRVRDFFFQYNSANQPIEYRRRILTGTPDAERFTIAYNAQGRRTQMEYSSGSSFTNMSLQSRQYSFYNANNEATSDSTRHFNSSGSFQYERMVYSYSAAGKPVRVDMYYGLGGVPYYLARYDFSYDAFGRLTAASLAIDNGGSTFDVEAKDTLGYLGNFPFPVYQATSVDTGNGLELFTITTNTVNAQGLRDTSKVYSATNTPLGTTIIQYNTNGLPVRFINYEPATGSTPSSFLYFYYETYTTTVRDAAAAPEGNAVVYPNPARDHAFVHWSIPVDAASIAVVDVSGRTLAIVPASGSSAAHTAILDLRPYAGGLYFLRLVNKNGTLLQTVRLLKQ